MHKAERAIIMAAGMGMRLRPATNDIPKPMVKVNGVRMIESIIRGLYANGIHEIYVVTGYKAEAYDLIKPLYPDVRFVHNPYYETRNNISTMYMVREHLHNCICIDGDNLIYNPEILKPEFEYSGYAGIEISHETAEWLMVTDKNRFVQYTTKGGNTGWQLFGVCHVSEEDGKRISRYLEEEYIRNRNYGIWWDEIALFLYRDQFRFQVHPIHWGDIQEIDCFSELCELDPGYLKEMAE
ncbi:MAG: phosphocholine cytidylyltransferase family protein [Clostridiales bacterium]|nr:phosphocholine cytidylyltransferase family protein [Clostridiales bacterium]